MNPLLTLVLALSSPAFAEDDAGSADHPCFADRKKFCGELKPGKGAMMECMRKHEAELSDACKAKRAARQEERKAKREERQQARKEKMGAMREACQGDMHKLCKDVKPGGGAKIECLRSHAGELSAACKAALPEEKKKE